MFSFNEFCNCCPVMPQSLCMAASQRLPEGHQIEVFLLKGEAVAEVHQRQCKNCMWQLFK